MCQSQSCHQGCTCKTREGIVGHVCYRVQSDRLRIDHALVQTTDQAAPLQWRYLCTCHRLPGSYPLPCERRIQHSWLHCSSHSSFHTPIRSQGSSFLEPTCRRRQNKQRHHHPLVCRKWHTRREAPPY